MAPTSARFADWRPSFPQRSRSRKPRPSSATAYPTCSTTSPPIHHSLEAVLGAVAERLGRMETATHSRHTTNGRRLASCRVSAVLEMTFPNPIYGRSKACQPRDSSLDLSDGGREPDVGSAVHSGELLMLAFKIIGGNGFTLDTTGASVSSTRPSLGELSAQPPRGYRGHGLFRHTNSDVRRS